MSQVKASQASAITILWYATTVASISVVVFLAYQIHLLHTKRQHRTSRASQIYQTRLKAAARLQKKSVLLKTPRASAQLSAGLTSTPDLNGMMDGDSSSNSFSVAAVLSVPTTQTPVPVVPHDNNEENHRQTATLTTTVASTSSSSSSSTELNINTHFKPSTTPLSFADSPLIPSVVDVLKAQGSARDRLLKRRRQLLVKKKKIKTPGRKRLVLTPRQQQNDILRKMR
jgi:hypothetical protein